MKEIKELYELFRLDEELRRHLLRLSDSSFPLQKPPQARVIVETLIIENGQRRVVNREDQDA
jgi:hypothetical protein